MQSEIENILISRQVNPTAMRGLVLEYLLQQKAAISLGELESEFDFADRTTLYRTLKTFEERGLIHTIKDGTEVTKYALCEDECYNGVHSDMHIHFYCANCKELYCLPKVEIPELNLPDKYKVQEVSLIARGLCSNCCKY